MTERDLGCQNMFDKTRYYMVCNAMSPAYMSNVKIYKNPNVPFFPFVQRRFVGKIFSLRGEAYQATNKTLRIKHSNYFERTNTC